MKSAILVAGHIQDQCDAGLMQRDLAKALGMESPNYLSMLKRHDRRTLLSPNRIPVFAKVCDLTPRQVMRLTLDRLEGACTEFCVNGQMAGNCRPVWRHNELTEACSP